ncbi:MAG: hypothetical protein WCJ30_05520, partial [Deltaproteobacteria bacterium]
MAALSSFAPAARGHAIAVDGVATEWFTRGPAGDNQGIIARDATAQGEFVWRDATGDQRSDLGAASDADLTEVHVTASSTELSVLLRFASPVGGTTPQVQIAIDMDRVAASGQTFLAGFADTTVPAGAAWEYLLQTQTNSSVRVLDATFATVGTGSFQRGGSVIELSIPWSTLGHSGPPIAPLRFTVATFYETGPGDTTDIGGAGISNALDVVSSYGAPQATGPFPNTWTEVGDGRVDHAVDVFFGMTGDVYAPVGVAAFVAGTTAAGPGAYWTLRNVSPVGVDLATLATGDAPAPGGPGGMGRFPAGILAPSGTVTVAESAMRFTAFYGRAPDYETGATSPTVPDLAALAAWSSGTTALGTAGGSLVLLDGAFTLLDVVTFGTGSYPGMTAHASPAVDHMLRRNASGGDTDDSAADFADPGMICGSGITCGTCQACTAELCAIVPAGTSCADGDACNGAETCNAGGACVAGTALVCADTNPCTADACNASTGCTHTATAGASCSDGNACNGAETCNAGGACVAGTALACADTNPCTADACNASTGCTHTVTAGASCSDGDACNGAETCNAGGACVAGTALTCADTNPCTADACNASTGCTHTVTAGASCSDGDACNGAETCNASGTCVAGTALACADTNPCTADA